ncbi:hypothetical protein HII36_26505 [Nonomuraea sp. NN258]|uniref:RNA polymerase sigma factor n=1 Tax=Nonomuraea antri TaxID=2730852 RepID=UPI0015680116|nr:hypothetical protein [Nonomuraea antri]NRQ35352.1 hypothetical protein [Nonomuraea antri]
MWRNLSDDARQAIRELCEKHGSRLYDYCRTELAPGEAEQAVAGTILTAYTHGDRIRDPGLRRAWMYALARTHRAMVARPASIGSWSRPGRMSELLPEALLSLERPQRELLDLSVRHGLGDAELAMIFDVTVAEAHTLVTRAACGLEEWFAAIIAARTREGCPELTARVAEWVAAPGRRARARIGRHIHSCATCRAAPRTVSAGALLRRLPLTAMPGTLPNRLALAQPLPGEGPLWRADGFPVQTHTLAEGGPTPTPPVADATPMPPVADPTTATSGKPWSAAGAAAADQEHPNGESYGRAARGRHPFSPPSRTRAFRGGPQGDKLVFGAPIGNTNGKPVNGKTVNGTVLDAHPHTASPPVNGKGGGEGDGRGDGRAVIRYGGISWSGDLPGYGRPHGEGVRLEEYWQTRQEDDDPEAGLPIRTVARVGLIIGVGLLVAGLAWAIVNAQQNPPTLTRAAAKGPLAAPPAAAPPVAPPAAPPVSPLSSAPADPPAASGDDLRAPSGGQADAPSKQDTGGALRPMAKRVELPRPAPPVVKLVPASVRLGSGRAGSFSLSCTGTCEVTSTSATRGIVVTGTTFRVKAPRTHCAAPAVRTGRITVRWTATTTGDGVETGGTTSAKGTLTMRVSWTIAKDKGMVAIDSGGTFWSECD